MIFRTIQGNIININKYDFVNDVLYYKKIMEIKQKFIITKTKTKTKTK